MGKLHATLLLLSMQVPVFATQGALCFEQYDLGKYSYKINTCDENGVLKSIQEYFLETKTLSSETFYSPQGIKVKRIGYSIKGDFTNKTFKYTDKTTSVTTYARNTHDVISWKQENIDATKSKLRNWKYESGKLQWIDTYSQKHNNQIVIREMNASGESYHIQYKESSRYNDEIQSFQIYNKNNREHPI